MVMTLMKLKQSRGFSLVELLVAMVVGLIIVSGAFSLHSGSRKIQIKSEEQMDMVADARFAIEMIAYDLRHAGMWGGTNKDGLITCRSTDTTCVLRSLRRMIARLVSVRRYGLLICHDPFLQPMLQIRILQPASLPQRNT